MMRARSPTAATTSRSRVSFSASEVTGDSPVVPERTRPSHPASTKCAASRTAVSTSRAPSASKGVTIAVSTVPSRATVPPAVTA
ncbi:Uncharacterised protein [Mycobacteroides abscessus subsp. abscessus]|nr:Uncharacterised protein [Mycobacteroides abscessus subsp. abscessus]